LTFRITHDPKNWCLIPYQYINIKFCPYMGKNVNMRSFSVVGTYENIESKLFIQNKEV
jgi:hypothetical protein